VANYRFTSPAWKIWGGGRSRQKGCGSPQT
jgi:hypothetical protein